MRNDYRFNHIDNYKNAIGAPVVITKGEHKGKKGIVTDVIANKKKPTDRIFEITLASNEGEKPIVIQSSDYFDAIFVVDITLEDGKKYFTMRGDAVTMHKSKYGDGFYVEYSEVTKDPRNDCTEHYEPNGFAYHYDCGMNILKEWKEDTKWYSWKD